MREKNAEQMFALLAASVGSAGDRDPAFRACVAACAAPEACSSWRPPPSLRVLGWSCLADCRYGCMWRREGERRAAGAHPVQYFGKWPFARALGMQEPISAALSFANALAHAAGLHACWAHMRTAPREVSRRWLSLAIVAVAAWCCAAAFHARDVWATQCADYFSALLLLLLGAYVAAAHLVIAVDERGRPASARRPAARPAPASGGRVGAALWCLGGCGAAWYAAHVRAMLRFFDFGAHMRVSERGGCCCGLWRPRRRRHRRPRGARPPPHCPPSAHSPPLHTPQVPPRP